MLTFIALPDIVNLGALAIVFLYAIERFFGYLNKKSASSEPLTFTRHGGNGKAGDKSSDWWELTFARIMKQCLEEHEIRTRMPTSKEAAESRQEILNALRALEKQLSLAVVELSRQIRDK